MSGTQAPVFKIHGVLRSGASTCDFGSWWEAARHNANTQIERWVLTTSVSSPQDSSGRCYSYMLTHGEDTLVTCNGLLLVIEGATLQAVQEAWSSVASSTQQDTSRRATSKWPALPIFEK